MHNSLAPRLLLLYYKNTTKASLIQCLNRVNEKKSGARSKQTLQTLQTRRIQIPRKISFTPKQASLDLEWVHGNAEETSFPEASFDLVTASLLFHETPPIAAKSILRECYRLLIPGGEVLILDGNQKTLRQVDWLSDIFEEPYIKNYAVGSVDAWMGAAGFEAVQTEDWWWVHQITKGIKPIAARDSAALVYQTSASARFENLGAEGTPVPVF
ncbi:MAG: class I SAM-dependent methyltransferase [Symploca sp. SIO2E9]|nr:class I SAM-dependent methyltransferase [Symploca sp. SIO2E9]